MKALYLLILAMTVTASAQTAEVIKLSDDDAAQAKAVYEARDKANQDFAKLDAKMHVRYLVTPECKNYFTSSPDRITSYCIEILDEDHVYSPDFKYIVPVHQHATYIVKELSAEDADAVRSLYEARERASKHVEDMRKTITGKYLRTEGSSCLSLNSDGVAVWGSCSPDDHRVLQTVKWDSWEFSEDYKFIVPTGREYLDYMLNQRVGTWQG